MKIAFALHQIQTADGPISPGTVTEFNDKHFVELKALGAIREPNDDELALANLGKAHVVEEPADNPLHAEAEALGIKFKANISDETLSARITAAKEAEEAAAKEAEEAAKAAGQTDADVVNL